MPGIDDFTPLHEIEQLRFTELCELILGRFADAEPALVRAKLHDQDVSVVVAAYRPDPEHVGMTPLAVLVDPRLFEQLLPPGDPEIQRAG